MNSRLNNAAPFVPDPDVFLQNCRDFTARFPEQAAALGLNSPGTALQRLRSMPDGYVLLQTRSKDAEAAPTLSLNGLFLHSKYDPQEEARRVLASDFFQTKEAHSRCIFAGLGLGYLATQYIERFPAAETVMIEPDTAAFVCFLAARRRASFFRQQQLSLLIGTTPEEAASFLAATGWNKRNLFKSAAFSETRKDWYEAFFTLLERNRMKNSINAKTLERFGTLWLKNTVKNLEMLCSTAKIGCFHNAFPDASAVVLAGGPSLTAHLELIQKHQHNFLIIAVDTAVRACARAGITPDFILSFDPQYWNYLHTAGLDTAQSILISEAAVFPAVLRQQYRAVFLSNSSAPFARYLESTTREARDGVSTAVDETLAAGGSVATTAWDFARYIGATTIIMAGLDLAYPHKQTHFAGSTFEEAVHTRSSRVEPAEQANVNSLYAAFPALHKDYAGGAVLTDRRMQLYAWWFESTLAKYAEIKTYNLMPQGVFIPGMPACAAEQFSALTGSGITRSAIDHRLQTIIDGAYSPSFWDALPLRMQQLTASVHTMTESTAALASHAEEAAALCRRLAQNRQPAKQAPLLAKLNTIDEAIRSGFAKDLVAVLFFHDETDERDDTTPSSGERTAAQHNGTTAGGKIPRSDTETQPHSLATALRVYERIGRMALQVHDIFAARNTQLHRS